MSFETILLLGIVKLILTLRTTRKIIADSLHKMCMWTNHVVKIRVKVCACYEEIKYSLEWGLDSFEGQGLP